ncbi:alpha/beta hydrolase fold [Quadrisphaera granulorum]|uniref:Alpha/beta hydrolase family protein n=2 Tax=Quadrisphaera granulorum TaxID=317664 RepID=A0A316A8Z6_9ACTN|nr:alpha/beta hydrolase family protein [Quadrisphaera granulorum]SZE96998.1 alpha/beta hydrolase fold [Quadrisphaera granulorum]
MAVAACSGPPQPTGGDPTTLPPTTASATTPGEQATDPAYAAFYDQKIAWKDCGGGLECGTVTVPVDWARPDRDTVDLAVARHPATDPSQRLGSLLVNPGGPGASGVAWLRGGVQAVVSDAVQARYDVVAFDPRGTGSSQPIDCMSDAEFDTYRADPADPTTPAGLAEETEEATRFAQGCEVDAGLLLGHLGTVDVVRDLDVLRAVVGSERLDYLGKSYGTLLGAEYAGAFPQRVGRLVLDGALDPSSSSGDVALVQAEGLERSLRAYAEACPQRSDCRLGSTADAVVQQVRDVLSAARQQPLPTSDAKRPLTAPLAFQGILATLYTENTWSLLDSAVESARGGDGARLLQLADAYAGRQPDGTYSSNLLEAYTAITCLDRPVDASPQAMQAQAQQLEQRSPTFGRSLSYGALQCGVWPIPPTRTPAPVSAPGAAPILVVGTTNDPATPYVWAQSLASQLSSGRLLTWDGQGHTAYRRGSACVDGAVDGYLLGGVLPGENATCTS